MTTIPNWNATLDEALNILRQPGRVYVEAACGTDFSAVQAVKADLVFALKQQRERAGGDCPSGFSITDYEDGGEGRALFFGRALRDREMPS